MTTQHPAVGASPSAARTIVTLIVVAAVAVAANSLVAWIAILIGADPAFPPLMPAVFGGLTVVGLAIAYLGWRLVRRRARSPRRVLAVIVPALLVLSFVPDVVTMAVGFIPHGSPLGYVALMIMHPIVVALAVPAFLRVAPLERR